MPAYSYRAVDSLGNIVQGSIDVPNERALETHLRNAGSELLRCAEKRARTFGAQKVSRKELIGFCFHMEQMTRAGLPILEALADLRDSVTHPPFREVISSLITSVESGKTLSQSMKPFPSVFDQVFTNLIAVGEETGELPSVLLKLTESIKWQDELIAKAKSVILYPAFVGVVVLGVMLFMMLYVVPQMVDFIQAMGNELPIHTRALIGFSSFLVNNWWWSVPAIPAIPLLISWIARRNEKARFRVDGWKLRAWYVGPILTRIILSRFASCFALCYGAGLDVLSSLRISQSITGNTVIAKAIGEIEISISEGRALSAGIEATGLFPALVIRMVKMGESTGRLDSALANISYFYDREVNESIDRLKSLIEPAMTVVLGAIMAWIMLSVLGPIYDTISTIGN